MTRAFDAIRECLEDAARARETVVKAEPTDDAPDLSAPEWQAKFAAVMVNQGRPEADNTGD